MRAVENNRTPCAHLGVILVADAARPVEDIVGPGLDVHTLGDRANLFTCLTNLVDDLVLLFKNTYKGVLETRRVPRGTLRLMLPVVNSTLACTT